jgi:membrane-bound lytic murein transglycosylase B
MHAARVLTMVVFVLASACTRAGERTLPVATHTPPAAPSPAGSSLAPSTSPSATPQVFLPAPDAPIPADPGRLADALVEVTTALRTSIDRWRHRGGVMRAAPEEVVLQALYQQRICRTLAADARLAGRTLRLVPGDIGVVARYVVTASARLTGLVRPVSKPTSFKTGPPKAAGLLLGFYREAERRFGVRWQVLAALNYIESKFGRVKSTSYAGAQGPMQFIPSTWAAYGMGGDIQDPHDAILGAANYLHRSGAPGDYRRALYAYNHSWQYVDVVLLYARMIERDIRNYFSLYNWQVFVLTPNGSVRITGPGLQGQS